MPAAWAPGSPRATSRRSPLGSAPAPGRPHRSTTSRPRTGATRNGSAPIWWGRCSTPNAPRTVGCAIPCGADGDRTSRPSRCGGSRESGHRGSPTRPATVPADELPFGRARRCGVAVVTVPSGSAGSHRAAVGPPHAVGSGVSPADRRWRARRRQRDLITPPRSACGSEPSPTPASARSSSNGSSPALGPQISRSGRRPVVRRGLDGREAVLSPRRSRRGEPTGHRSVAHD